MLKAEGVTVQTGAYRSPNTNALVERFIQTLQQECLDHFVVFGEKHMNHLVSEFVAQYQEERPHQSKGNEPLLVTGSKKRRKKNESPPPDVVSLRDIKCRQRLGGLLKHYVRKAA